MNTVRRFFSKENSRQVNAARAAFLLVLLSAVSELAMWLYYYGSGYSDLISLFTALVDSVIEKTIPFVLFYAGIRMKSRTLRILSPFSALFRLTVFYKQIMLQLAMILVNANGEIDALPVYYMYMDVRFIVTAAILVLFEIIYEVVVIRKKAAASEAVSAPCDDCCEEMSGEYRKLYDVLFELRGGLIALTAALSVSMIFACLGIVSDLTHFEPFIITIFILGFAINAFRRDARRFRLPLILAIAMFVLAFYQSIEWEFEYLYQEGDRSKFVVNVVVFFWGKAALLIGELAAVVSSALMAVFVIAIMKAITSLVRDADAEKADSFARLRLALAVTAVAYAVREAIMHLITICTTFGMDTDWILSSPVSTILELVLLVVLVACISVAVLAIVRLERLLMPKESVNRSRMSLTSTHIIFVAAALVLLTRVFCFIAPARVTTRDILKGHTPSDITIEGPNDTRLVGFCAGEGVKVVSSAGEIEKLMVAGDASENFVIKTDRSSIVDGDTYFARGKKTFAVRAASFLGTITSWIPKWEIKDYVITFADGSKAYASYPSKVIDSLGSGEVLLPVSTAYYQGTGGMTLLMYTEEQLMLRERMPEGTPCVLGSLNTTKVFSDYRRNYTNLCRFIIFMIFAASVAVFFVKKSD